jgi:hypothetical protein
VGGKQNRLSHGPVSQQQHLRRLHYFVVSEKTESGQHVILNLALATYLSGEPFLLLVIFRQTIHSTQLAT